MEKSKMCHPVCVSVCGRGPQSLTPRAESRGQYWLQVYASKEGTKKWTTPQMPPGQA
jgi:hypothetical protein